MERVHLDDVVDLVNSRQGVAAVDHLRLDTWIPEELPEMARLLSPASKRRERGSRGAMISNTVTRSVSGRQPGRPGGVPRTQADGRHEPGSRMGATPVASSATRDWESSTTDVFDVRSRDVRGERAHLRLEQFFVCLRGSVAVGLDDGREREEVLLDTYAVGLYIPHASRSTATPRMP
jgi:hypothetical protein